MDGMKIRLAMILFIGALCACSTQTVDDTVTESGEEAGSTLSAFDQEAASGIDLGTDEFVEFDSGGAAEEAAIESEIAAQSAPAEEPLADEFAAFEDGGGAGGDQMADVTTPPAVDPGAEFQTQELPPPPEAPAPEAPEAVAMEPTGVPINIKALQFRANDNGGTIVIEADGPVQFTTRQNPENNQFVIEIPNSNLPKKLQRPLNTKDFAGAVGSIDAYQTPGTNTTNVVVQLRAGEQEPTVQAEGNSLLVVTNPVAAGSMASMEIAPDPGAVSVPPPETAPPPEPEVPRSKLMTSSSLEEFIANNQTFYGKKVSIETDEVEIREVFKLISEEANVNLILAEDVRGKISVKLKNVPWDQALVLLMKTKKLGYTRSGNVIRISNLSEIRAEEKEALDLMAQRRQNAVPKVRTVQVNYAKVEDLEKQIKGILSKTGAVVADTRTSSLIITDFDENIDRAVKVVQSLDVPPQQVLIEGKIVEAKEDSNQSFGIQWSTVGQSFSLGGSGANPITGSINNSITPELPSQRTFTMDFRVGAFDILGDLNATLSLFEKDGKAKILSSPRIVAMHNEKASIEQTLEVPIRSSTVSAGAVNNNVTFKEVKLLLEVTPQVTNDGAVLMGVKMQREFLGDIVDSQSGARANNRRLASTRVLVRNGQTAVIGGIYQNDSTQSESRVPGLGNLPVIGWLFKGNSQTDEKNELLIFLTPRILGQLDSQVIPSQNNMEGGFDGGLGGEFDGGLDSLPENPAPGGTEEIPLSEEPGFEL